MVQLQGCILCLLGLVTCIAPYVEPYTKDVNLQYRVIRSLKARAKRLDCTKRSCRRKLCDKPAGWNILGSAWGCCGNYEGCCTYAAVICYLHDAVCRCCDVGGPRFCGPKCQPEPECIANEKPEIEKKYQLEEMLVNVNLDVLGFEEQNDSNAEYSSERDFVSDAQINGYNSTKQSEKYNTSSSQTKGSHRTDEIYNPKQEGDTSTFGPNSANDSREYNRNRTSDESSVPPSTEHRPQNDDAFHYDDDNGKNSHSKVVGEDKFIGKFPARDKDSMPSDRKATTGHGKTSSNDSDLELQVREDDDETGSGDAVADVIG